MGQNELQTSNVDTPTLKMSCIHRSYIGCSKRGFSHNRFLSESHSFTPHRKKKKTYAWHKIHDFTSS
jgi:hypothetical protein